MLENLRSWWLNRKHERAEAGLQEDKHTEDAGFGFKSRGAKFLSVFDKWFLGAVVVGGGVLGLISMMVGTLAGLDAGVWLFWGLGVGALAVGFLVTGVNLYEQLTFIPVSKFMGEEFAKSRTQLVEMRRLGSSPLLKGDAEVTQMLKEAATLFDDLLEAAGEIHHSFPKAKGFEDYPESFQMQEASIREQLGRFPEAISLLESLIAERFALETEKEEARGICKDIKISAASFSDSLERVRSSKLSTGAARSELREYVKLATSSEISNQPQLSK